MGSAGRAVEGHLRNEPLPRGFFFCFYLDKNNGSEIMSVEVSNMALTVELTRELRHQGFTQEQAENIVIVVEKIVEDRAASRSDLLEARSSIEKHTQTTVHAAHISMIKWLCSTVLFNAIVSVLVKHFG